MDMKQQEQLQEALAQCIEKMQRGASVDACVAEHAEHAEALRPLLAATLAANAAYRQEPSKEARARGRARLQGAIAEARSRQAQQAAHHTWLMPLKAWSAAMAGVVLFGGGFGVIHAASGSLPSETLYPVRRAVEKAQMNWPFRSDEGRGQFHEALARRRADEMVRLATRDQPGDFTQASALLGGHVQGAATLALKQADRMLDRVPPEAFGSIIIIIPEDGAAAVSPSGRLPEPARPVDALPANNAAGQAPRPDGRQPAVAKPAQAKAQAEHWQELIQQTLEQLGERRARMQLDYENSLAKFRALTQQISAEQLPRLEAVMARLTIEYQAQIQRLDAKVAEGAALREEIKQRGQGREGDAPKSSPPQERPQGAPSTPRPKQRPTEEERAAQQATQAAKATAQAQERATQQATLAAKGTPVAQERTPQARPVERTPQPRPATNAEPREERQER
ncbi:MAG: hypothetical protein EXR49_03755 [Dehalococcoidia bacterium]|nr:hypothetical protein [Dehalococcoidia bacterium]